MLLVLFEENKNQIGIIVRDNLNTLLKCISWSKTITSEEQARLIISFLVGIKKNKNEQISIVGVCDEPLNTIEGENYELEKNLTINQIIEQLRIFVTKIHEDGKPLLANNTRIRG